MRKRKFLSKNMGEYFFLTTLIIFLLAAIILAISLSPTFYFFEFQKHNVYAEFIQSPATINEQGRAIIEYLKETILDLDPTFFSEQARVHMKDVQVLIGWLHLVFLTTGCISLCVMSYWLFTKQIKKMMQLMFYSGVFLVIFSGLVFFATNLWWEWFFLMFHEVMFSNDYWLFAPSDNLIKMLPEPFFQDMVTLIGLGVVSIGISLGIVGWYGLKFCHLYVTFRSNQLYQRGDTYGQKKEKTDSLSRR